MAKILIKNGRVWDGKSFFDADVFVDGNQVVKIAKNIDEAATFVFDAKGMTVSAGLIDAHTHLRGISCDKYGTQAEMSCFPFGVTAAADGGAGKGDKALLESFMLKTLVFVAANIKNNQADFSGVEKMWKLYKDKMVGVKSYFDSNAGEIENVKPLEDICTFAHKRDLRVMVHCTGSPISLSEILSTLQKGDILTHAFNGSANNAEIDGFASMKDAQKRGVLIDVGFAGNVHTDFGIMKRALEAGIVPDIISTDITRLSAFVRGGRYGLTMCMSIAKLLGMSEDAIFRAVTSNPATALGMSGEWGRLKEGGKADVAVIRECNEPFALTDKNQNTVKSEISYRCALTISDGQIVYKD